MTSDRNTSVVINGPVISFSLSSGYTVNKEIPVNITFQHLEVLCKTHLYISFCKNILLYEHAYIFIALRQKKLLKFVKSMLRTNEMFTLLFCREICQTLHAAFGSLDRKFLLLHN